MAMESRIDALELQIALQSRRIMAMESRIDALELQVERNPALQLRPTLAMESRIDALEQHVEQHASWIDWLWKEVKKFCIQIDRLARRVD